MSAIRESIVVNCPTGQTSAYLTKYLKTLEKAPDSKGTVLHLEVPLGDLGLPGNLVVSRRAVATFTPIIDPGRREYRIAVLWAPEGGGPFPRFSGFITVEAADTHGASLLTLEGKYAPPLGVAGKAFDAAIGQKIARATVHKLLATLGAYVEEKHRDAYAPPTIPTT